MKKLTALSAALCAFVCAAPLAASAATIVNGSFEMGMNPPTSGFTTLGAGSTDITGWTVSSGSIDWIGTYWQASNGTHSIDLSGDNAGSISTSITGMTAGQVYRLFFDLSANPDGGPALKEGALTVGLSGRDFDFTTNGQTHANMGWRTKFLQFVATSDTEVVKFSSSTPGFYGPAIDNVRVLTGVPELSTWAMMGLGFLGLAFAGRKRLRRVEAI